MTREEADRLHAEIEAMVMPDAPAFPPICGRCGTRYVDVPADVGEAAILCPACDAPIIEARQTRLVARLEAAKGL